MKNKMRSVGATVLGPGLVLVLVLVLGLASVCFAHTPVGSKSEVLVDDAKIYAEVKASLEKYEASLKGDDAGGQYQIPDPAVKHVGPLDEILAKCDLLVQHGPKMADYYRLRGKARYYRAIDGTPYMFIDSVALADAGFAARFSPADVSAGIKDMTDALAIQSAGKLDDTAAAGAHVFRGKLYAIASSKSYSRQNLVNAILDLDEAARLDPYDPPPTDLLKGIYLLSKDGDLIGQDLARRIKDDPSAVGHLYLERAAYLSTLVEYNKVLADLMRYAGLPGNDTATDRSIIALRYATLNKYAGDAYKKSSLNSAEDYLEKAQIEIQFSEKRDAAFADATEAAKRNTLLTAAHVIRAKVLLDTGKIDEGMAEANIAIAQDPDNVGALCIRALGLAVKNDIRTLDDLNRAITLDAELAFQYNAFGNRARIYTALGKSDLAAADAQKGEQMARKLAEIRH